MDAADEIHPLEQRRLRLDIYEELRRIAARMLRRTGSPMQATSLVHDALLRLHGVENDRIVDRDHFLLLAARVVRFTLCNRLRADRRRASQLRRVPIGAGVFASEDLADECLAVHEALARLQRIDDLKARITELRFFGGLKMSEIAAALGESQRTVEREWTFARVWLRQQIGGGTSA